MSKCRSEPCQSCPYRKDCPSGVWAQSEYDKLRDYDNETSDQPFAPFHCHVSPDHLCHGWVVVHTTRAARLASGGEHAYDVIALRLFPMTGPVPHRGTVEFYDSGNEAADHGEAEIEEPSIEARLRVDKLLRKSPRLRKGNPR